ncbi:MAG: glycosyltransferase [Flavobacteriales bacterium]|nr:glycosyltransferase [Flavobacteriales bacterium]
MTDSAPLVSVVMPVFNAERFLREAITSILEQRFTDLEFILINDGSTDGSAAIIASFTDPRITVITQANQGISAALNTGIAAARGGFIARMDADDVSHPDRIAQQVAFLQAHPDIGMLGTWATVEDEHGNRTGELEHPTDDARIRYALLFDSPFVHPSMMVRGALFQRTGGYDSDPAIFEDHDLWSRMILHTRAANLPAHLLRSTSGKCMPCSMRTSTRACPTRPLRAKRASA